MSLAECIRIWRAGCIIQSGESSESLEHQTKFSFSDAIADFLAPLLQRENTTHNLLLIPEISKELGNTYQELKQVVKLVVETDAVAPALSATLEWMKSVGARDLPTDFEEMELDCRSFCQSQ